MGMVASLKVGCIEDCRMDTASKHGQMENAFKGIGSGAECTVMESFC